MTSSIARSTRANVRDESTTGIETTEPGLTTSPSGHRNHIGSMRVADHEQVAAQVREILAQDSGRMALPVDELHVGARRAVHDHADRLATGHHQVEWQRLQVLSVSLLGVPPPNSSGRPGPRSSGPAVVVAAYRGDLMLLQERDDAVGNGP